MVASMDHQVSQAVALVRYEQMRVAVQQCATIDEAAEMRDKAAALAAYARQRDDTELDVWMSEIRLRACTRIGELVRELDTAAGRPPENSSARPDKLPKQDAIADAGLSRSTAYEYQELAGGRDEQAQAIGKAAAEAYYTKSRDEQTPATMEGLRGAIQDALVTKRERRERKEAELAEATVKASRVLGKKLYGVIYADPPWRFEPYSRQSGMDRAADNHYPTMTTEDIRNISPPAAEDCALFLWATVPMLQDALATLSAWGFQYKSHCIWEKDRIGTGYWFRNRHEILLVGVKGKVPAPAPGQQFASVVEARVGEHSVKPFVFSEMIEEMFPNLPKLEMFARRQLEGWDVWGNEVF